MAADPRPLTVQRIAVEGLLPGIVVGDRVFDVQDWHLGFLPSSFVTTFSYRSSNASSTDRLAA